MKIAVLVADAFQDSEYFFCRRSRSRSSASRRRSSPSRASRWRFTRSSPGSACSISRRRSVRSIPVNMPGCSCREAPRARPFVREHGSAVLPARDRRCGQARRPDLQGIAAGRQLGHRQTPPHDGFPHGRAVARARRPAHHREVRGIWVGDQPVVVDGNLISSRHPDDVAHFIGAIRDWLKNAPKATEDAGNGAARARIDQGGTNEKAVHEGHTTGEGTREDRARFPAHRPADPRPGGMARGDPGPHAGADPGSRPRDDRGVRNGSSPRTHRACPSGPTLGLSAPGRRTRRS